MLSLLYGDSYKYTKNPPQSEHQSTFGLIQQSAPSADPFTFFPDRHMSGWKRKRVTLFLGIDSQRAVTEDLGRKEVIKELLPGGWSIFFGMLLERSRKIMTNTSSYRKRSTTIQQVAICHGTARAARRGRNYEAASEL